MIERILYGVFLFFLIIYAPFWLYLPAVLFGIIIFPLYFEAIIFSLIVDYYYGPHMHSGTLFSFPFAITSALLILALIHVKERIRIGL
jgi:hypothetical protein